MADHILGHRREYFRLQQMIRDHRERAPEDEQARADAEAELDRLIGIIRFGCARLMAWLAVQVAVTETLTGAQARIFLIANGDGEETMNRWRDRPEETARTLTGDLKRGPGRPADKLVARANRMAADAGWRPGIAGGEG